MDHVNKLSNIINFKKEGFNEYVKSLIPNDQSLREAAIDTFIIFFHYVNHASTILNTLRHYGTFQDKLAGTVIKAKLGIDRDKAVDIGKTVELARDNIVHQLNGW